MRNRLKFMSRCTDGRDGFEMDGDESMMERRSGYMHLSIFYMSVYPSLKNYSQWMHVSI